MSSLEDLSTPRLILQILGRRDKLRLGLALVLILIGTLLEVASLGIVIPVVQQLLSEDLRLSSPWLPAGLRSTDNTSFVILLMGLLVAVFLIKNLVLIVTNYIQLRIQVALSNRISHQLFEQYLRQPYEFHLVHSSSILVRNVQEFSSAIIANGVNPLLVMVTEVVTGLGLIGVLLVVEPVGTISLLFLFALTSLLVSIFFRSKIRRWGAERIIHRGQVLEALISGFGGIKEIKLFGRDQETLDAHRDGLYRAQRSSTLLVVAQGIPRAVLEVTAVVCVGALVVIATLRESDLQNTMLLIALFAVAAFRMLPSANRLIQSIQMISFGRAGIEGAVSGLSLPVVPASVHEDNLKVPFAVCRVTGLKYRYPNTARFALDVEELEIRARESIGVVGASGSGKSTLIDILIGVLTPTEGTITVNGQRISENARFWQDRIGYVPQHVYLMDTTVRKNVAFGLPDGLIDTEEVERALRLANLWEFVESLPAGLETVVGERGVRMSGGQRQRLGIARALYGHPEVIVLDEATSALDEATELEIVESMRKVSRECTLIVVAHRLSTLAHCSRLIRLDDGRVVEDGSYHPVIEPKDIE